MPFLFLLLLVEKRTTNDRSIFIDIIQSYLLVDFFPEGNNPTASSFKDKQSKDSGIIQDPNIIGRELFVSEIKEFYPASHIK